MIPVPDWLLVTIQWVHHMGAVAWVGGSIFFRFVLQPAFRKAGIGQDSARTIGQEFGSIVRIAIVILIVTGAFMAVVHLSAGGNSRLYIGILALKITLAFYMFLLVWLRRRSAPSKDAGGKENFWPRFRRAITGTTALLILGVVVIGLADVLGAVHDSGGHAHGSDGHSEVMESNGHASDDHHESGESGNGHHEDPNITQPTEEPHDGESDHHGDDNTDDDHADADDGDDGEDGHDHSQAEGDDGDEDQDGHATGDEGDEDAESHAGDGEEDDGEDGHDHSHAADDEGDEDQGGHASDDDEDQDEGGQDDGHDGGDAGDGHDDGHDHSH